LRSLTVPSIADPGAGTDLRPGFARSVEALDSVLLAVISVGDL